MIGESEYNTASTLPMFAKKQLEYRGIRCSFVHVNENDPNDFAGIEALKDADLLFLSVRRRTPPKAQLDLVRAYLAKGKPLVGIRTASHAFDREPPSEHHARWAKFDDEILGVDYRNHHGNKPPKAATVIQATAAGAGHPILTGVPHDAFEARSHLYKNKPVATSVTVLMAGTLSGRDDISEPVAWTNEANGNRVFYTSLGGVGDFGLPAFQRLLLNGVLWALDEPVPPADPRVVVGK
jgi:type 1 glutamine amidotransferase